MVEDRFSPIFKGRVAINSTAYGNCGCGHAWLTLDKEVVANFCTRAFWNRASQDFRGMRHENNRWVTDSPVPEYVSEAQRKRYGELEYGELSRQNAYQSCWEFVHDLSVDDALSSDDPLIQTLAVLDSRLGKRRLNNLTSQDFHPLAKRMLDLRQHTEGIVNGT